MKAVILAAGRGTRMGSLTDTVPKPMLVYKGKNLLEHKLDVLGSEITEVIMVVGYLKEVIMNYFGNEYKGKKIRYVEDIELKGSAAALWLCKDFLSDHFLVMMGDDIYPKKAIENALQEKSWTMTAQEFHEPHRGYLKKDEQGFLREYDEGVTQEVPNLVNTGLYTFTPELFLYPLVQIPGKTEFGIPQTLLSLKDKIKAKVLVTSDWKQITAPEDLV